MHDCELLNRSIYSTVTFQVLTKITPVKNETIYIRYAKITSPTTQFLFICYIHNYENQKRISCQSYYNELFSHAPNRTTTYELIILYNIHANVSAYLPSDSRISENAVSWAASAVVQTPGSLEPLHPSGTGCGALIILRSQSTALNQIQHELRWI